MFVTCSLSNEQGGSTKSLLFSFNGNAIQFSVQLVMKITPPSLIFYQPIIAIVSSLVDIKNYSRNNKEHLQLKNCPNNFRSIVQKVISLYIYIQKYDAIKRIE